MIEEETEWWKMISRDLKDMERDLDFIPSPVKLTGLKPGHEMIHF